jgi:hypothetical protein
MGTNLIQSSFPPNSSSSQLSVKKKHLVPDPITLHEVRRQQNKAPSDIKTQPNHDKEQKESDSNASDDYLVPTVLFRREQQAFSFRILVLGNLVAAVLVCVIVAWKVSNVAHSRTYINVGRDHVSIVARDSVTVDLQENLSRIQNIGSYLSLLWLQGNQIQHPPSNYFNLSNESLQYRTFLNQAVTTLTHPFNYDDFNGWISFSRFPYDPYDLPDVPPLWGVRVLREIGSQYTLNSMTVLDVEGNSKKETETTQFVVYPSAMLPNSASVININGFLEVDPNFKFSAPVPRPFNVTGYHCALPKSDTLSLSNDAWTSLYSWSNSLMTTYLFPLVASSSATTLEGLCRVDVNVTFLLHTRLKSYAQTFGSSSVGAFLLGEFSETKDMELQWTHKPSLLNSNFLVLSSSFRMHPNVIPWHQTEDSLLKQIQDQLASLKISLSTGVPRSDDGFWMRLETMSPVLHVHIVTLNGTYEFQGISAFGAPKTNLTLITLLPETIFYDPASENTVWSIITVVVVTITSCGLAFWPVTSVSIAFNDINTMFSEFVSRFDPEAAHDEKCMQKSTSVQSSQSVTEQSTGGGPKSDEPAPLIPRHLFGGKKLGNNINLENPGRGQPHSSVLKRKGTWLLEVFRLYTTFEEIESSFDKEMING